MILDYKKSTSTICPVEIDTISSKTVVYLRKNIVKKQRELNINGKIQTYYEYDEAKLTKDEYEKYLKELSLLDIQQQRADIDYIALMSGISLDEV